MKEKKLQGPLSKKKAPNTSVCVEYTMTDTEKEECDNDTDSESHATSSNEDSSAKDDHSLSRVLDKHTSFVAGKYFSRMYGQPMLDVPTCMAPSISVQAM